MAPTLDEIRAGLAEVKPQVVDLNKGILVAEILEPEKLVKLRYEAEACPACGEDKPMELGVRHGGLHYRCRVCTFEFTFKPLSGAELDQHVERLIQASKRFTEKAARDKERKELYERARRERRRKYTIITLPNGEQDAELHLGQFSGRRVSDLAMERRGRDYLRWMLSADFEEDLTDIIHTHIDGTDGR